MEILKFRYWDNNLAKYIYSDEFDWPEPLEKLAQFFDKAKRYSETVEQFIGKIDKDGEEIYEGDVVYREAVNNSAGGKGEYLIKWNENASMFGLFSLESKKFVKDYHGRFYNIIPKKTKVIADIHDIWEVG